MVALAWKRGHFPRNLFHPGTHDSAELRLWRKDGAFTKFSVSIFQLQLHLDFLRQYGRGKRYDRSRDEWLNTEDSFLDAFQIRARGAAVAANGPKKGPGCTAVGVHRPI